MDEALKTVSMYEYRLHAPHLLSGGQKQRVAIAGVLAMQPRCSSWTSHRYARPRRQARGRRHGDAGSAAKKGMTVVLITHHMSECVGGQAHRHVRGRDSRGRFAQGGLFPQVELLRERGALRPRDDGAHLQAWGREGFDLPLEALTVGECADAVMAAIKKAGGQ